MSINGTSIVAIRKGEQMSDPIERQDAIDEIRKCRFVVDAIEKIIGLPSARPEIIHCENCKNWQTGWRNREWGQGYHWCSCVDGVRRSDWFCADAERREDDQQ